VLFRSCLPPLSQLKIGIHAANAMIDTANARFDNLKIRASPDNLNEPGVPKNWSSELDAEDVDLVSAEDSMRSHQHFCADFSGRCRSLGAPARHLLPLPAGDVLLHAGWELQEHWRHSASPTSFAFPPRRSLVPVVAACMIAWIDDLLPLTSCALFSCWRA